MKVVDWSESRIKWDDVTSDDQWPVRGSQLKNYLEETSTLIEHCLNTVKFSELVRVKSNGPFIDLENQLKKLLADLEIDFTHLVERTQAYIVSSHQRIGIASSEAAIKESKRAIRQAESIG